MSARTTRTRVLAAAALAIATLTLTACGEGEGVREEGSAAGSASTPSARTSEGTSTGAGKNASEGSAAGKGNGSGKEQASSRGKGTQGQGSTQGKGSQGQGSSNAQDPGPVRTACSTANTRLTATVVSRPLNHMLLTVTNTGSKACNVIGYPAVRFTGAQSVPPVIEDSQPQAVVTLAPGESGYAGVALSAADGSGSNGYTAKTLGVYLNVDAQSEATPSLPAKGVYVDDTLKVTYWQSTMDLALSY